MKATPEIKRELIVEAKKRCEGNAKISRWLKVSPRTVRRIWERYRETNSYSALPHKGRKPKVTESDLKNVEITIRETPDITLDEMIEKLDLPIKKSQLSVYIISRGYSYKKKTLHASAKLREDVQLERAEWVNFQCNCDVYSLVFIDETSINCAMTRLYGRAKKNERVNDYTPDARFERTSIISSIRLDGEQAPMMFKGTLDGDLFEFYITNYLAPTLKKGDTVVMDSLSAHKVLGALDAVYEKGASVRFQPRYSPDFNPIELAWSKLKAVLRKLKARTFDELVDAANIALDSFSLSDIRNWFAHHGYVDNS